MKKKIVISVFLLLISITVIAFICGAIYSYRYDINSTSGIDTLDGIGVFLNAVLISMIGGFVVFYELDLFYTVYYFLINPKTLTQSILNISANFSLVLLFFSEYVAKCLSIGENSNLSVALFSIYVTLRIVYIVVFLSYTARSKEMNERA